MVLLCINDPAGLGLASIGTMKIAVLGCDQPEKDMLCRTLISGGYRCEAFEQDDAAWMQLRTGLYDMLIVAWHASGEAAGPAIDWAKRQSSQVLPVMAIAGLDDLRGTASVWDARVDDYLVRPIRKGELLMRVEALLRHAYPLRYRMDEVQFGLYLFDLQARRITVSGQPIDVTQKEFDLALLLFQHLNRPLSRTYIVDAVWSSAQMDTPSRSVDTHVSRVRNKLGLRPENGYRLVTVYSYGYQLEEVTPSIPIPVSPEGIADN